MRIAVTVLTLCLAACGGTNQLRTVGLGGPCSSTEDCVAGAACIAGTCQSLTYAYGAWSDFGTCSTTCGDGTHARTRSCLDSTGKSADCGKCGGACSDSATCSDDSGCTYHYGDWGDFGSCSTTCGNGTHARTRSCVDSAGRSADCAKCGGACSDSAACSDTSACTYSYGAWGSFDACTDGQHTRHRPCMASDGIESDCSLCGGQCDETEACTSSPYCPQTFNVCDGNSQDSCNASLQHYMALCQGAGCTWTGATTCVIGGSPSSSQCWGGTGSCH